MNDRKMVKWLPFDAVISAKKTVYELNNLKNIKTMPILSEEQINENELILKDAIYFNSKISILYFKSGTFLEVSDYIKNIDVIKKRIILKNNSFVYFSSVVEIKILLS